LNLIQQVYKTLRKEILHGEIAPGTRLVETQLAERFEISRTPVREALSMLKYEGLVSDAPGSGVVVSECSVKDVEELMGVRAVLEEYALDQAFDKLTEIDILQLELFIKKAARYVEENDPEAVFEANTEFHNYILGKSGNKRLEKILSNAMDSILRYRMASLHYPGNPEISIEKHARLVDAIKRGNKEEAKALLVDDIHSAKRTVLKFLEEGQIPT
jgi:DNA-binding GntR family transcriptional regulator